MPSDEDKFVVPSTPTTTNKLSAGDHATESQLCNDTVLFVHVMPSGDVIRKPFVVTAANKPSVGDHAIDTQA